MQALRSSLADLDGPRAWRWALWLVFGLTLARLIVLFVTPLELYVDEAQYWLWSRTPGLGYVSKPPMIAWLIRLSTLPSDGEAWVRLFAPLLHAGAMLALFRAGLRLYGPAAALLASALWGLMPAVQISALFISTDAPLMLFLCLGLWAYAALLDAQDGRARLKAAAALGAALGLGFLSKQAAIYAVMGLVIHAAIDRDARRAWGGWTWAVALGALVVVFGPNLIWQATHGFVTVAHTAEVNARLSGPLFNPGKLTEFVLGQFGVLGPVPFGVLLIGTVVLIRNKVLERADRMLLGFVLPPLLLITAEAFVSRAHAHWAAAGYPAATLLVSAWLVRWRASGWTVAALVSQGVAAALALLVVAAPQIVDAAGYGRRLERLRGWAETAALVTGEAASLKPAAVVVEDRAMFNDLAYYGRRYFREPGAAPLRVRPAAQALSEAERSSPLRPQEAGRVLIVEQVGKPAQPKLPEDFMRTEPLGRWTLDLGGGRERRIDLYLGVGYAPAVSARPTRP